MNRESKFQTDLIRELRTLFPNCIILKNDSNHLQGFPDLLILVKNKWAALEVKSSKNSIRQPNQRYYVDLANDMSYASFVYPENIVEVLDELHKALRSNRSTRISLR